MFRSIPKPLLSLVVAAGAVATAWQLEDMFVVAVVVFFFFFFFLFFFFLLFFFLFFFSLSESQFALFWVAVISVASFYLTMWLIPIVMVLCLDKGLFGRDLNKVSDDKVPDFIHKKKSQIIL